MPASEPDRDTGRLPSLGSFITATLLLVLSSSVAAWLNAQSWGTGSISIVWPTTGLLIGILICSPRRQWPAYFVVAAVIDVGVDLLGAPSSNLTIALYQTGCNAVEAFVASWFLYPVLSPGNSSFRSKDMARLMIYGVVLAPAVASLLASFQTANSFSRPNLDTFAFWFTADALGIGIITPLYLCLQKRAPFSNRSWSEVILLLALLCGVSIYVFWQTALPLFFLLLPFLLLVEVRLGLAGSTIGLVAVAMIGGFFTPRGRGPIALTHFTSLSSRTFTLQFFIFVCMVVLYIVEVVRSSRDRFESRLRASEQRFRLLAENSHDIIFQCNLQKEIEYVSPAVTEVLGWEPEEMVASNFWSRSQSIHPDDLAGRNQLYEECLAGGHSNTMDYRVLSKDGKYVWLEINLALYRNHETGAPAGFINVSRDISKRKAAEEELNRALDEAYDRAFIDELTGVANRRGFDQFFETEWRRAIRMGSSVSLLMIDVDYFKLYNDRYGHVSGDNCLKEVASVIAGDVRRSTDTVCRYGGEEFAVVLPDTDEASVLAIAEQIRTAMASRRIPHAGSPYETVTISIGCATTWPVLGSLSTELIESADRALYQAKSEGKNRVV